MNRSSRKYDHGELPSSKKKEFWNPDGQAFQAQIPANLPPRPKPECSRFTVENGEVICHHCDHPHTVPTQDVDRFVRENVDKMQKRLTA